MKKSEIIALDESDVMAITVRRLVEEHAFFRENRILFSTQTNLSRNDMEHLTTIGNLYDMLSILFAKVIRRETLEQLRFYRPSDDELTFYYEWTAQLFDLLGGAFPEFGEYLHGTHDETTLQRFRADGGHVLFRPVGLLMFSEILSELVTSMSLEEAVKLCTRLPVYLTEAPYAKVIYDPDSKLMNPSDRPTTRKLLLYMLGRLRKQDALQHLHRRYAELLGKDVKDVSLPPIVV